MNAPPEPEPEPGRALLAARLARWKQANVSLSVLAILAGIAALWAGREVIEPVVVAVTLAVLLWPMCRRLTTLLHSRTFAALVSVLVAAAAGGALAWGVAVQLSGAGDRLPEVLKLVARDVGTLGVERALSLQRTRAAIAELDRSVARATGTQRAPTPAASAATGTSIVSGAVAAAGAAALVASKAMLGVLLEVSVMLLLTFFLLANAPALALRLQRACTGLTAQPGRCEPALSEAARQVLLFARVTLVTNLAIGVAVAAGFFAFDVPDAAMWGLAAAALHFVPYAGMAAMTLLAALEVYAAQGSLLAGALGAGYVAFIGITVGTTMTVWLQGRSAKVDSAVLFAGTLFWAVLWGGWGLVLGPLMVVIVRLAWRETGLRAARAQAPTLLAPDPAVPAHKPAAQPEPAT